MRTLLVEDDLALHEVVCSLLEEDLGHDPTCVKSVDEAITAIATSDFDVAIVDWMLGAGTCEPVLAALAAATPPVPAIVYSASAHGRATAERWSIEFIDKPFEVSLLVDTIARSIRDRRSPRPPKPTVTP